MAKIATVEDFRSVVLKQTELPKCCGRLLNDIDDLLVYQQDMKKLVFIHAIFEVIEMVFAGSALESLQEVGIEVTEDAVENMNNAPDLPQFMLGLNQIARSSIVKIIQPHIVHGHSGACRRLKQTKKFWMKMLDSFS